MGAHNLFDYLAGFVLAANVINLLMPPWERFQAWPNFQSRYRLVSIFIGYWSSLNFKSRLWPEISVDNQIKKANNGGNGHG